MSSPLQSGEAAPIAAIRRGDTAARVALGSYERVGMIADRALVIAGVESLIVPVESSIDSKLASSMTTRRLIADCGNLAHERRVMGRDQPIMIDQENSIIVGQKNHH